MEILSIIGWICATALVILIAWFLLSFLFRTGVWFLAVPTAFFLQLFRYMSVLITFFFCLVPAWWFLDYLSTGKLSTGFMILLTFLVSLVPALLARAMIAFRLWKL
jgi:hypothetical protein